MESVTNVPAFNLPSPSADQIGVATKLDEYADYVMRAALSSTSRDYYEKCKAKEATLREAAMSLRLLGEALDLLLKAQPRIFDELNSLCQSPYYESLLLLAKIGRVELVEHNQALKSIRATEAP